MVERYKTGDPEPTLLSGCTPNVVLVLGILGIVALFICGLRIC